MQIGFNTDILPGAKTFGLLCAVWFVAVGCLDWIEIDGSHFAGPPVIEGAPDLLATGTSWTFRVKLFQQFMHPHYLQPKFDDASVRSRSPEIISVESVEGDKVTVRARAPGKATLAFDYKNPALTVERAQGKATLAIDKNPTLTVELESAPPKKVDVLPACTDKREATYVAGTKRELRYRMESENGSPAYGERFAVKHYPNEAIQSVDFARNGDSRRERRGMFVRIEVAEDAPEKIELEPELAGASVTLHTIDSRQAVDGLRLRAQYDGVSGDLELTATALADGRPACIGSFELNLKSKTPSVCSVDEYDSTVEVSGGGNNWSTSVKSTNRKNRKNVRSSQRFRGPTAEPGLRRRLR